MRRWERLPVNAGSDDLARRRVRMPTLGKIGHFGDQVFQYAFLQLYARAHGLEAEVPAWAGQRVFGPPAGTPELPPPPPAFATQQAMLGVDAYLPLIAEYLGVDWKQLLALWLRRSDNPAREVSVCFLDERDLDPAGGRLCRELIGWFQFHTRWFAPHRPFIRSLFRPGKAIEDVLLSRWRAATGHARPVIGLHVRRGDRLNIPLNTNEWCAPIAWYEHWLEANWAHFDRPLLFLASDSLPTVRPRFSRYRPLTSELVLDGGSATALSGMPEFYPDFFLLGQCDILLTSNSMFSFTASMLGERARRFYRPDLEAGKLVEFDPWDSQPVLRRAMYTSALARYREYLALSRLSGGWAGLAASLLVRLPRFWLARAAINAAARVYGGKLVVRFAFHH